MRSTILGIGMEADRRLSRRLRISLLVCLVLLPESIAIIWGIERWPFTCSPMFAQYITPAAELHSFEFEIQREGRWESLDPPRDLGISERNFRRLMFTRYYGSSDPSFPPGRFPDDTPDAFRQRMSDFFEKVGTAARRKGNVYDAFRIGVVRETTDPGQPEKIPVCHYDYRRNTLDWEPFE